MSLEKGKFLDPFDPDFTKLFLDSPLDPDFTKLILDPALFVKNANKYAAGLPIVPALNNKNNK